MTTRYKSNTFIGTVAEAATFAPISNPATGPLARSGPGARFVAEDGTFTRVVTRLPTNVLAVVVET